MSRSIDGFLKDTGWSGATRKKLAGDASTRSYERVSRGEDRAMLMIDPDASSIETFLNVTDILHDFSYSAPRILEKDAANGLLLLEDLGDDLFAHLLRENPSREEELYRFAVDFLIDLTRQEKPIGLPYFSHSYVLDQNTMFLDWYVPEILGEPLSNNARFFFQQIWQELLEYVEESPEVFLHRDFHAENLIYLPERKGLSRLGLLDYQDAMTGPAAYDLASLLQDARRFVSPQMASNLIDYYVSETKCDEKAFRRSFAVLGAHRCLRIMGIFTRLAKQQNKNQYTKFMPRVMGYLNVNLAHPDLVALRHWIKVTMGSSAIEVRL